MAFTNPLDCLVNNYKEDVREDNNKYFSDDFNSRKDRQKIWRNLI